LRKNELNKPSVFKAFCGALHQLPSSILYLDLSGNGFNSTDYNLLSQFSRLPKTLKFISFGLERPVDLQAQMNKALMPAYLPRLINQPLNVMQKAQLLLNDYTQGNSWFWRTIYGYWNRHHLPVVSKLFYEISKGHIQFIEDILHQLSLLEMQNEAGALAKSTALLYKEVPQWRAYNI
jgi:hypothetical protein